MDDNLSEIVTNPTDNNPNSGLVGRPAFQLRSLPLRFRWEATRRHPYYLWCWETKTILERQEWPRNQVVPAQMAIMAIGRLIGYSGEIMDPATSFETISEMGQVDGAWASGAIEPVTLHGLAASC